MAGEHYVVKHWSSAKAEADYRNKPPTVVTVNDRAAVRDAIITRVRQSGFEFVPRSDWAAHKSRPAGLDNDWTYNAIAIHTAGRSYTCGPAALQMQQIQDMHMKGRGWSDIAYHYAMDCFGNIYEGRDIRFKGAHLSNFNTGIIGIVLLENLMEPNEGDDFISKIKRAVGSVVTLDSPSIPEQQEENLKVFVKILQEFFPIKTLGGHREFPRQNEGEGHTCPGNVGLRLVGRLRKSSGLSKP